MRQIFRLIPTPLSWIVTDTPSSSHETSTEMVPAVPTACTLFISNARNAWLNSLGKHLIGGTSR